MKKFISLTILFALAILPAFSVNNVIDETYLKSKRHIAIINPIAENIVSKAIKKSLKKEAPGKYKVSFKGYTISSMKEGIFKYLEITGINVTTPKDIEIPYFNIKTVTDYNKIDYNSNPIVFKTDTEFDCIANLSEKTINDALAGEEYKKVLNKVNKKAYPLFMLNDVFVKIKNNKLYIIMSYNFPIAPKAKDRTFMVSSGLKIVNNEIITQDIAFDNAYGNLPLNKVANLINLLNPLNFTTTLLKDTNSDIKIEKIEIKDNFVEVSGKIFIKGDK